MKNFIKPGNPLEVTAPYAVTAGAGLLVGSLFGVAHSDAANGADVVIAIEGVFDLKTKTTDVAAQGAIAYWDNTNKEVTVTATSNTKIGVFTKAKVNGATTSLVRLNGAF